jgi:hypothetical protein
MRRPARRGFDLPTRRWLPDNGPGPACPDPTRARTRPGPRSPSPGPCLHSTDHAPASRTMVPPLGRALPRARLALGPPLVRTRPVAPTRPGSASGSASGPLGPARPDPAQPSPAQPSPAQPSQNTADSRSQLYLRPGQYPGRNRLPRVGCRVRIRRRSGVSPRHRVRAGVIAERALTSFRPATMLGPPRFRAYRQTNPAASDSARMRPRDPGLIS